MHLYVESITGRLFRVDLSSDPELTVLDLKSRIFSKEGILPGDQSLVYRNAELENFQKLAGDCGLKTGARVRMIIQTRSGPRSAPSHSCSKAAVDSASSNADVDDDRAVVHLMEYINATPCSSDSFGEVSGSRSSQHLLRSTPDSKFVHNEKRANFGIMLSPSSDALALGEEAELDMTFTEAQRHSAQQRAQDNVRTMAKMRNLKVQMERLQLGKVAAGGGNAYPGRLSIGVDQLQRGGVVDTSRQRRSSGGRSAAANQRIRGVGSSSNYWTGVSYSTDTAAYRFSAQEDTSAKESSAGETELEEGQFDSSIGGGPIATNSGLKQHRFSRRTNTVSSSSDLESSCAALTSDPDLLQTADDCGFGDSDQALYANMCHKGPNAATGDNGDAQHDSLETRSLPDCISSSRFQLLEHDSVVNSGEDMYESAPSQFGVDIGSEFFLEPADRDELASYSDPSELSSGMIICELGLSRRPRIRKKIRGDPGPTRRFVAVSFPPEHPYQNARDQGVRASNPMTVGMLATPQYQQRPRQRRNHDLYTGERYDIFPDTADHSASDSHGGDSCVAPISHSSSWIYKRGAAACDCSLGPDPRCCLGCVPHMKSAEPMSKFSGAGYAVTGIKTGGGTFRSRAAPVLTSHSGSEDGLLEDTEEAGSGVDDSFVFPVAHVCRPSFNTRACVNPMLSCVTGRNGTRAKNTSSCGGAASIVKRATGGVASYRMAKPSFKTRPRSKPRLKKTVSTGESSSDDQGLHSGGAIVGFHDENSIDDPGPIKLAGTVPFRKLSHANETTSGSYRRTSSHNFVAASSGVVGGSGGISNRLPNRKTYAERSALRGLNYPATATASSSSSLTPLYNTVRTHRPPQSSQSQQRCNTCGCKLNISNTFQCRCGKTLCSRHRTGETHGCSYDYKGEARRYLKEGTKVLVDKLPKI